MEVLPPFMVSGFISDHCILLKARKAGFFARKIFEIGAGAQQSTTPFRRARAPDKGELEEWVELINQRVGRCLQEPAP